MRLTMSKDELIAIQAMLESEAESFQKLGDEADAAGRQRESVALRAGMAALRRMSAWIEKGEHWHYARNQRRRSGPGE